jgi:glutamate-1-semialdehyde 2,1-aminomutase
VAERGEAALMRRKPNYKKSRKIFKAAKRVLVGGVDSPVRAFTKVGRDPVPIQSGRGSKIYDYDGNEYIDYVLSYGALILGHAHPQITGGIKDIVSSGVAFGATSNAEVELAECIRDVIPIIEKIRFVNSGTEAVMGAVRLARGVTKRNKIVKFEGSYHGHADYLLAKSGSGLATMGLPASDGVPSDFTRHTLIAQYGDKSSIEDIFEVYGSDIAAVLVEPVGGNSGVVLPDIEFLKFLRSVTRKYGALLIFDEVITGFRFHFGSAAAYFGIRPDIICLGKIIGGGLPIGAYGGSERIMNKLAPLGKVYQASTFAGNPVVMNAGLSTLKMLGSIKKDYKKLNDLTCHLCGTLREKAQAYGIGISVRHFGTMFSIHFKKRSHFRIFYRALLDRGVYFAPSEYESNFVSFAHKKIDIKKTIRVAEEAFRLLARKG